MFPVIAKFGPLTLHSYGLMLALGFGAAIWLAMRRAPHFDIEPAHILDLSLWVVLAAMVGSRLMFVALYWEDFSSDLLKIVKPPYEGLVWYGGFILALPVGLLYARRRKWNMLTVMDVCAPAVALGHAIGRVGCVLHGCCFGSPTSLPWGICYPKGSLASETYPGAAVHPSQLYESAGDLALMGLLLWFSPRRRYPGHILAWFLVGEGLVRFLVEFTRGDDRGTLISPVLSPSQWISLAVMAVGVGMLIWKRAKGKPVPNAADK